jgi:hypothetical protein
MWALTISLIALNLTTAINMGVCPSHPCLTWGLFVGGWPLTLFPWEGFEMQGFTVECVHEVKVLPVSLEGILYECAGASFDQWEYAPQRTNLHSVPFVARVAIGYFDTTLTIEEILRKVDIVSPSPFGGSGAWVRSAYLRAFPKYDGKGPILFPHGHSLWKDKFETRVGDNAFIAGLCATGIWHDNGRVGPYSFDYLGDRWREGKRVALIVF